MICSPLKRCEQRPHQTKSDRRPKIRSMSGKKSLQVPGMHMETMTGISHYVQVTSCSSSALSRAKHSPSSWALYRTQALLA